MSYSMLYQDLVRCTEAEGEWRWSLETMSLGETFFLLHIQYLVSDECLSCIYSEDIIMKISVFGMIQDKE